MKPLRVVAAMVAVAVVLCLGIWSVGSSRADTTWRTAPVSRQDVRATVSATGTLEPVTMVEVGTQVTGIVAELLADFNDRVEAGQVIARIDTSLLDADVASARARVAVAEAQLKRAELALKRAELLTSRQAGALQELEGAQAEHAVAVANLTSARVDLQRASRNLGYATIHAPIDGTVVERAVEVGQTVNAGMAAPTLFFIAGSLERMRIVAAVDEADIGRIAEGQRVRFTVQAHPQHPFEGQVQQVRLQSTLEESVVTYAVVIDVDNAEGLLLPGMTATVEFVVDEALDALCLPNAALRFRPPDASGPPPGAASFAGGPGAGPRGGPGAGGRGGRGGPGGRSGPPTRTVHRLDARGDLAPVQVTVGLTDGRCTVVEGELTEGTEVVIGVERASGGGSANPFRQQSGGTSRWRGGF